MQEQDNKHLDNIIRSSFEKRSKGAPDKLWGTLSSALDADATIPIEKELPLDPLDKKVKESFSSLYERAPRHVWSAINRQLNIDRVWQGINSEFDKAQPLYWPNMRIAAAILLLLLSGAGAYSLFSSSRPNQPVAHSTENIAVETGQAGINNTSGVSWELIEKGQGKQQEPTTINTSAVENSLHKSLSSDGESDFGEANNPTKSASTEVYTSESSQTKEAARVATAEVKNTAATRQSPGVSLEGAAAAPVPVGEVSSNTNTTAPIATLGDNGLTAIGVRQQPISSYTSGSTKQEKLSINESVNPVAANSQAKALENMPEQENSAIASSLPGSNGETDKRQTDSHAIPFDIAGVGFISEGSIEVIDIKVMPLGTVASRHGKLASLIEEKTKQASRLPRFEAGPVMVYNNSWLLNNETKSSYDKNSLIATDLTYKQNWGLVLNYRFSKQSILSSEMHIASKAGQQYKMYEQGEYLRKGLELRYYKLYLQYQRNFLEYGKNVPSCLSVQAGVYAGYLQNKRGEIRQEESRYANFDYGLKLALGQEHDLKRFTLGYGVRAERGLTNIFRGTERLPAEFNRTYILNLGTYINMRYSF